MRTLNNIFYDDEILLEFRNYLQNKQYYQNTDYKKKFRKEPFSQFQLTNNQIVYKPKKLIVIGIIFWIKSQRTKMSHSTHQSGIHQIIYGLLKMRKHKQYLRTTPDFKQKNH
jgi:hypothetical protein